MVIAIESSQPTLFHHSLKLYSFEMNVSSSVSISFMTNSIGLFRGVVHLFSKDRSKNPKRGRFNDLALDTWSRAPSMSTKLGDNDPQTAPSIFNFLQIRWFFLQYYILMFNVVNDELLKFLNAEYEHLPTWWSFIWLQVVT